MEGEPEKKQRSSDLSESAPRIGKWEMDLETGTIHWSDELYRIFGLEPQAFVPTLESGLAFVYSEDREKAETAYHKAITHGEEYCIEKRIIKPDGRIAVVLSIGTVIKDQTGKIIRLLDIFQDISATKIISETLKQTVEDLKARNKYIETIIESIPIGIAVNRIDDGRTTLVNGPFCDIYGWNKEDFSDVSAFFSKIYPDIAYRNEISQRIFNDIQSGDPARMKWDNISIVTSTGETRKISAKNIPLSEQNLMISTVIDVTQAENHIAEISRIKTNQDALINGTDDLIWSIDKNLRLITANKPYREMIKKVTGRDLQEGDLVMAEEYGQELNKKWEAYYQRVLNGEIFEVKEQLFNLARQRMEYFQITFHPMYNELGELFGAACYSKDITEETRNLITLEKTKAELQSIMDSSLDMICSIDASGTILNISAACTNILGYTRDELIGQQLFDFLYPEDKEASEQMADMVMKGVNTTYFENRYVRKDGSLVPLSWSARWDPDKKIRYGVAHDATVRKISERALIESERKYKYLFENNPLPIIMWDFKTLQIVDCNQEAINLYGYTRDEFLQLNIKQLRPEEDIPLIEDAIKSESSYGEPHHRIWRHKKKNGEIIYTDITAHLIEYNNRKVSLALSLDVTESRYYHELDKLEKDILEINASRQKSLAEVIMIYLSGIEELHPGMLCSIQEKRGNRLFNLASPSLPTAYLNAIEGTEIGDNTGSCCTAAFLKKEIIAEDIEHDIRWANYKDLADQFHLRSCWSTPVLDSKNNVLVTFACYYQEIKKPSKQEKNTIRRAAHILQIILEGNAHARALEISNERFEYVTKATSDIIWDWDLEKSSVYYSDNIQKLFGHKPGLNYDNLPFYFDHVHPDDRERVVLYPEQIKHGSIINWEQEYRFRKADGEYAFVMDRGIVIRDQNGLGIRMVGAMNDITTQKENELKLLKSGQELDLIYNNVKDVIFMIQVEDDQKFRFISINQSFVESTGIEKEKVINKLIDEVIPEPSLSFVKSKYKDVIKGNTKVSWEETTTYPSGTKTGIVTITPVCDPDGVCRQLIGSVYDITERKQEERRLLLLESVITHASDAVLITEAEPFDDPGPRIVYVNNAFTKMTGYSAEEVIGKSPRLLQGPKTDQLELKRLSNCIRNWQPCEVTIINYKKNGEEFWINFSVTPISDDKGWFTHWISIERDVTERKKTEQALETAYEEKNIILESIGDAFFALDQNWVVTYWNNHAERTLSIKKEAILGHNLWEVFSDSIDSESYRNYHQAVETNQIIHFEDYYAPINAWYEISAYPSLTGLSVYFKDITERKLIEQRLKAERNLLRTLIDNLPHSVYFKDRDARKLISNKVDYELLGLKTEEEVLGKTDLEILPPPIASAAYEQDNMILNSGKPLINYEHFYTTPNGTWIAMLTTKIPLFDEKNEVIGLLGIGRDITEQKIAEKKLRELNVELEKNIKQLMISNAELEQFAYVASHDLQEPLRMVSSFLTLIEKKYSNVVDEKGKQYIHFAVDGAKRMRQIILDLLDFSRVGRMEDDLEEIDLNLLVGEIITLYSKQIEELQAEITIEKLPIILTYQTPIKQLLQNLIGNSLKYHNKNVKPVINISLKETKTEFQFAVKDNGIGIAPEYFEKIFIIFQRLHHKDEYSGTGMGLAIAKKIVENLGGKIWVDSTEGKGSTFYFTLLKMARS